MHPYYRNRYMYLHGVIGHISVIVYCQTGLYQKRHHIIIPLQLPHIIIINIVTVYIYIFISTIIKNQSINRWRWLCNYAGVKDLPIRPLTPVTQQPSHWSLEDEHRELQVER